MARLRDPGPTDDDEGRPLLPSLLHSPELAYLNRHYGLSREIPTGAGGRYSLKRLLKRFVGRLVFGSLAGYLTAEHEYLIQLVRFQNEVARRVDASMLGSDETAAEVREALRKAEEALVLHLNLEKALKQTTSERQI